MAKNASSSAKDRRTTPKIHLLRFVYAGSEARNGKQENSCCFATSMLSTKAI